MDRVYLLLRRCSVWSAACITGFFILLGAGYAHSAPPAKVTVCADPDPPPWTYWHRDAQGNKVGEFTGSSTDLIKAAFTGLGIVADFQGQYPWARCILMVERGQIDFAMDAYFDEERAKKFAYSKHYNTLTPRVFFRKEAPVTIRQLSDLKRYKGCGMNGASYAHYGLRAEELDLGNGYENLINKLLAKRCDYFVEEFEVLAGYRLVGKDYLANSSLAHATVPGATAPAKHLITARGSNASLLIPKLNQEIDRLVRSGAAAKIWRTHAGNIPYQP